MVIDLHTPVINYVAAKRKKNPDFTMSPDGVHVNNEGHSVLAAAIMKAWRIEQKPSSPELLGVISKRQHLLHQAWVSHVGHKRPGVQAGMPIGKAQEAAAKMEKQIRQLLKEIQ